MKKVQEENQETQEVHNGEALKIGSIELVSSVFNVEELGEILASLLRKKEVKEYLDVCKKNDALIGSYMG